MLQIFQQHYEFFCGAEKSALDFVYTILSVLMAENESYIMAYEFLDSVLKLFKSRKQREYLQSFSNELITGKYVILQFDTLEKSQSKHLLLATLRYLMTLQRYLDTINEHFEELMDFRFFCRLLCAANVRMELSLIAAQSASILFELRMAEYSDPEVRHQVDEFLCAWPHFLHTSFTQSGARPILLGIYGMIDFDAIAECNATVSLKNFNMIFIYLKIIIIYLCSCL